MLGRLDGYRLSNVGNDQLISGVAEPMSTQPTQQSTLTEFNRQMHMPSPSYSTSMPKARVAWHP